MNHTLTDPLWAPIPGPEPCGEDLSYSNEFDAIARLREADDPSLDQGEWVTPLKVADWPGIVRRTTELLTRRSKDLRLAGWLTEALAQTEGLAGLATGLRLTAGLAQRYWPHVHPLPDGGDQDERIGNIAWLLARVREQARGSTPTGGQAPRATPVDQLAAARSALQALGELQRVTDLHLGDHGPSFVAAREALEEAVADLDRRARESGSWVDAPGSPATASTHPQEQPAAAQQTERVAGAIASRAQALQCLQDVAEYFRRTEPHSPVAYLADKAVQWGQMPLHEWLRVVLKDAGSLSHVEELLGVRPAG